jgi:hypothetical protein
MKSLLRDILGPKEKSYYSDTHGTYGSSNPSYGTTSYATTGTSYGTSTLGQAPVASSSFGHSTILEPTFVEKKERAPVIQETVLPEERVEIQPIIHREREQLEVHQVVQPMRERDIVATEIRSVMLPAETRQEVRESDMEFQRKYQEELLRYKSGMNVQPVKHERMEKPAIIEEVVRKKVIEEIQPVIYRETIRPVVIQETLPIYEKIIEAPRIFVEQQRGVIDLGIKNLPLSSTSYSTGYQTAFTGQTRTTGQALGVQQSFSGPSVQQSVSSQSLGAQPVQQQPLSSQSLGAQPVQQQPLSSQQTLSQPMSGQAQFVERPLGSTQGGSTAGQVGQSFVEPQRFAT